MEKFFRRPDNSHYLSRLKSKNGPNRICVGCPEASCTISDELFESFYKAWRFIIECSKYKRNEVVDY